MTVRFLTITWNTNFANPNSESFQNLREIIQQKVRISSLLKNLQCTKHMVQSSSVNSNLFFYTDLFAVWPRIKLHPRRSVPSFQVCASFRSRDSIHQSLSFLTCYSTRNTSPSVSQSYASRYLLNKLQGCYIADHILFKFKLS